MKSKNLFQRTTLALAISAAFGAAHANPVAPTVVNGAVSIAQPNAQTLNITNSPGSIINWHGFSIGAGEATRFIQQNAASAVLNRVTGADPSSILGTLTSNGRVFLVNPNGIVFGGSSVVDVQGLVASTRDISNANFLSGNYLFENGGANSVVLQRGAQITTGNGGQVWLIANNINLEGGSQIVAPQGQVTLAAGTRVQVGESALGNMTFSVTTNSTNTLQSLGNIAAESGAVNLFANHIVQSGTLDVSGPTQGGTIKLMGDMQTGSVNVSGTLDASVKNPPLPLGEGGGEGGIGGFIETSAASVNVSNTTKITTAAVNGKSGTWLIDPTNYTIAASTPANGSYMSNSVLASSLSSGNVIIQTLASGIGYGDIFINAPVSWNANNTLTLSAYRNIYVNANLAATGDTAGLVLTPNTGGLGGSYSLSNGASITLSGLTPSLNIAGTAYTVINSLGVAGDISGMTLQGMSGNLSGHYALGSNIDATATSGWDAGDGFAPIGSYNYTTNIGTPFIGTFDGLGHTISGLTINRPTSFNIGLFGWMADANSVVRNVGLTGGSVIGSNSVGGLVGYNGYSSTYYPNTGGNGGTISNSYVTGAVSGASFVGGLVGYNNTGTISNSHSAGSVGGSIHVGGLVGINLGSISNSYSTGNVSGSDQIIGGLVGANNGSVSNSYATGSVGGTPAVGLTGIASVGGLVGGNGGGSTISNSYATGSVNGSFSVGGLVGGNGGGIGNSYATGSVTSTGTDNQVGGLVGSNNGSINTSYATGSASSPGLWTRVGGLVGYNVGSVGTSYATGNVNGFSTGGLVGWNDGGTVSNSYATGSVTGSGYIGGLAGWNDSGSTISNSYATGSVSNIGSYVDGGLVGYNDGSVSASYWDTATTGRVVGIGGGANLTGATGLTTAQMMTQANFTSATAANGNVNPAWGFPAIWSISEGSTRPLLQGIAYKLWILGELSRQRASQNVTQSFTVEERLAELNALQNPIPTPAPDPIPTPEPPPTPPAAENIAVKTLPTGAKIRNGQVLFQLLNNEYLKITNTPGAIIDWDAYSIGHLATVKYLQQDQYSAVLNRVVTANPNPSMIDGHLLSNGRVFLMNPNGITFGSGVTLDVNGLIASTLYLSNTDFLAGNYNFTQPTQASVTSQYGYTGKILGLKNGQQSWLATNEVGGFFPGGQINGVIDTVSVPLNLRMHTSTTNDQINADALYSSLYGGLSLSQRPSYDKQFLFDLVRKKYQDEVLQHVELSASIYNVKQDGNSYSVPLGNSPQDSSVFGYKKLDYKEGANGFAAGLYENNITGERIVVYEGTYHLNDVPTDLGILLTSSKIAEASFLALKQGVSLPSAIALTAAQIVAIENMYSQINQATNYFDQVKTQYGGSKLSVAGHSLGGYLAQIVGLKNGAETHTFNAPGVPNNVATLFGGNASNASLVANHIRNLDVVGRLGNHPGALVSYPDVSLLDSKVFVIDNHSSEKFTNFLKSQRYNQVGYMASDIPFDAVLALAVEAGLSLDTLGLTTAQLVALGVQAVSNATLTYIAEPLWKAEVAVFNGMVSFGNAVAEPIWKTEVAAFKAVDSLANKIASSSLFNALLQQSPTAAGVSSGTANSTPAMLPAAGSNINFLYNVNSQNYTVVQSNSGNAGGMNNQNGNTYQLVGAGI